MNKSDLKNIKAVFFDMDGIIVDSMPYHYIAWFEALKQFGISISPMDIFEREGAHWDELINYIVRRENIKITQKEKIKIGDIKVKVFKENFKRFLFPEIFEILEFCKEKNLFTALVTGSRMADAKSMLPKKILHSFDFIVAGDMVKHGKPFPDPYLCAAKNLKLKSNECFVVENAPYGIRAAKSAKMFCIAIQTSLPKQQLKKADRVFLTHKEFLKYFKNALKNQ